MHRLLKDLMPAFAEVILHGGNGAHSLTNSIFLKGEHFSAYNKEEPDEVFRFYDNVSYQPTTN